MGMFYRTIRLVENGLKPVYVFDGKPPEMKSDEVCGLFSDATLETVSLLAYLYCFMLKLCNILLNKFSSVAMK